MITDQDIKRINELYHKSKDTDVYKRQCWSRAIRRTILTPTRGN